MRPRRVRLGYGIRERDGECIIIASMRPRRVSLGYGFTSLVPVIRSRVLQ